MSSENATLDDVLAALKALAKEANYLRRNTAGLCERFAIEPNDQVQDVLEAMDYYLKYREKPTVADINFNVHLALTQLKSAEFDLNACRSVLQSAAPEMVRRELGKARK